VGVWNNIWLGGGDGPIPVFAGCSLRCYTGTVHTSGARLISRLVSRWLDNQLQDFQLSVRTTVFRGPTSVDRA